MGRVPGAISALAVAGLLAGCGGSGSGHSSTSTGTHVASTTTSSQTKRARAHKASKRRHHRTVVLKARVSRAKHRAKQHRLKAPRTAKPTATPAPPSSAAGDSGTIPSR